MEKWNYRPTWIRMAFSLYLSSGRTFCYKIKDSRIRYLRFLRYFSNTNQIENTKCLCALSGTEINCNIWKHHLTFFKALQFKFGLGILFDIIEVSFKLFHFFHFNFFVIWRILLRLTKSTCFFVHFYNFFYVLLWKFCLKFVRYSL